MKNYRPSQGFNAKQKKTLTNGKKYEQIKKQIKKKNEAEGEQGQIDRRRESKGQGREERTWSPLIDRHDV